MISTGTDTTKGTKFTNTRLFRTGVIGAGLLGIGVVGLLGASIGKRLFFHTKAMNPSDYANPLQLLECNVLVTEQLTSLSSKTSELLLRPAAGLKTNVSTDWKHFSLEWQENWSLIDDRCRFAELAETKMGDAHDRMAHVHRALPAMRLRYTSLLAEFDKEQAEELLEMRRDLEWSRTAIDRSLDGIANPAPHSPQTGAE